MEWLRSDLISAMRQARRAPVATAAVLASLALGIGANTAIFSLLNALLLRPLPVRAPEALVSLRTVARSGFDTVVSVPEFDALAKAEGVPPFAAFARQGLDIASAGQPARWVSGLFVSGDYFDVVGVAPVRGRLLTRGDDDRAAPAAVAVLSGGFWRSAFGAAPDVVGRTLTIQGHALEIVGVAEPGFFGLEVGQSFDVAVPVSLYAPLFEAPDRVQNARLPWLSIVGRLPRGQPLQQAVAAVRGAQAGVMRQAGLPPNIEAARLKDPWDLVPTAASITGARSSYRRPLLVLFGIVGLLLAVACVNVAHLAVARAELRQSELAVRLAMGASRAKLLRHMAVEAVAVALLGIVAGVALGLAGGRAIVGLLGTSRGSLSLDLAVDWRVLTFTALLGLLTVVFASVVPAWRASGVDPLELLRSRVRGVLGGGGRLGVRDALMGGQVAFAFVLTLAGFAFSRSFVNLTTMPTGFDRGRVQLVGTRLGGGGAARVPPDLAEAIRQRMRNVPGVTEVALSWTAPFGLTTFMTFASTEGPPPKALQDTSVHTHQNFVSAEYFRVMGIRLLEGQIFGDVQPRPDVVVVSRAFAQKFFDGVSPVGRTVWVTPFEQPLEVVGLVDDVKVRSLRDPAPPMVYHPWNARQYGAAFLQAAVRTDDRRLSAQALASAVDELLPGARVDLRALDVEMADTIAADRTTATLASSFAMLGLLLSALGVYGVLSHHVSRRTGEMGLRAALGASPVQVVGELFGRATVAVALGLLGGAGLAFALSRFVRSQLYGVTPTDAGLILLATLALGLVATLAAWVPTRRAVRLDPVAALRED